MNALNPAVLTGSNTVARYATLSDSLFSREVHLIQLPDFLSEITDDTVSLVLPGRTDTLVTTTEYTSSDTLGNFQWSGRICNQTGYINLMRRSGVWFGYVDVGADYYELIPAESGLQFLVRRSELPDLGCGNETENNPDPGPDDCDYLEEIDADNPCPALIHVLLAITTPAKAWILDHYGSIEVFAYLGIGTVNQAFYNSDIPNKEIRVEWVEQDFALTSDLEDDRLNLVNFLTDIRDAHQADVAVIVSKQDYTNGAGAASEIGPNGLSAFAIVEAPHFAANYTFAHELGHLLGGRHNRPSNLGDDPTPKCEHGWRTIPLPFIIYDNPATPQYEYINVAPSWHTVVAIGVSIGTYWLVEDNQGQYVMQFTSDKRILHYSNPDIRFNGYPTGTPTDNNARMFRTNACTVADFYPNQELGVFVRRQDCNKLIADIVEPWYTLPGQGPYLVYWYWNESGIFTENASNYLGQGAQFELPETFMCPPFFIKCVVLSSDGVLVSRVFHFTRQLECNCPESPDGDGGDDRSRAPAAISGAGLSIYPNPTAGAATLVCPAAAGREAVVRLTSTSGLTVSESTCSFSPGGVGELPDAGLPPGLYFLHLVLPDGEVRNSKLVITPK